MNQRILSLRSNLISFSTSKMIYESKSSVVYCKLNKPKALNALDEEMLQSLNAQIDVWEKDQVAAVILSGEGGKALCAGGDVKSLYLAKTAPSIECPKTILETFFWTEYQTDYKLATMKPTLIALMDGIVMGGGVGVSVHAPVRIASETSVFAMPETKLGLFTDVGGGYFLSRLKGNLGIFLGLTGYRLKGADLYHAGLADFYVPRNRLTQLVEEITNKINKQGQIQQIKDIVQSYQPQEIPNFSLGNEDLQTIAETFTDSSYENIIHSLQGHTNKKFSEDQIKILQNSCPISLRVTHEQIKRGKNLDLKQNLIMDFRIVERFMQGEDFFEGVKSVLVDKNHKPQWTFKDALKIPQSEVDKYFAPLIKDLEI